MDKCPLLFTTLYLALWSLSVLRAKMLGACINNSWSCEEVKGPDV